MAVCRHAFLDMRRQGGPSVDRPDYPAGGALQRRIDEGTPGLIDSCHASRYQGDWMSKFRPKTVFILGAGASWPYGFPTGLELRRAILRNLANNTPPFKMLVDAGCNPDNIRAFHRAFRGSQQDSVDAFMTWAARQRTSFVEIGRMAIAQVLIQRELEDWLLAENDEDVPAKPAGTCKERLQRRWYRYLWNRISDDFKRLRDANVAFITFNYDRSLEHFLFTAIRNTHQADEGSVPSVMDRIPIMHVHGRLGRLGWQKPHRQYTREFNSALNADCLRQAAEFIHIPGTDGSPLELGTAITQELSWAERVVFLGFGFHPQNLQTLGIPDVLKRKHPEGKKRYACATAYGLKKAERQTVSARLEEIVTLYPADHDCLELLRQSKELQFG